MTNPTPKYIVARTTKGGLGLAELVTMGPTTATIRRLKGQGFRIGRVASFKAVEVPASDVIREATRREMTLGWVVPT